jgi:hypothetical protein
MLISMILGIFAGAAIGLRFRVFVIVPVIGIACTADGLNGFLHGNDGLWIALSGLAIATSIQAGYLGGSILSSTGKAAFALRQYSGFNTDLG